MSINQAAARLTAVVAMWVAGFSAFAQDDLLLVSGTLTDDANRKKMPGVEVVVYQDGVEYDRLTTDARASYAFQLPLRHDYVFSYEIEGYGNKRIQVDASGVPTEDLKGGFNLDLDMSLFALVEGFDVSILEDPFGKASFDAQRNTLSFDFAYTDRMKTRVDNEFDRVERMAELLVQMKQDFKELMTRGQQFLDRAKWQDALKAFTDALALFPDDSNAINKQAEAQAALDAASAADRLEADFQAALAAAESFLNADKLDRARESFHEAAGLKPGAPEPAAGLARVDARETELGADAAYDSKIATADKAFKEQRYADAKSLYNEASALKPGERYARDQANACQAAMDAQAADAAALAARAAEYEALIELADKNFRAKNWREALRQYEEASAVLPAEQHPKDRAAKCRENLSAEDAAAAAAADAASAAAAAEAVEAAYAAAIDRGDAEYDSGNWTAAQSAYEAALEIKPGERYPTARLDRIASEVAKAAEADAEAAAAREAAAAAAASAAAQAAVDAAYQAALANADVSYDAGNWAAAVSGYEAALEVKPNDRYAKARLERANNELIRADEASAAEAAAKQAAAEAAARQAAEAAAAAAAAEAEAAAQAEREARAADAARAQAEEEAKRRAAEDEARKRAQEVAAALDVKEDDAAEAYYREALESERRAKAMEVEAEKERSASHDRAAAERAQRRRADAVLELEDVSESQSEIASAGAAQREQRVEEVEGEKERVVDQQQRMAERGTRLSREGMRDVEVAVEIAAQVASDHRFDYREEMPDVENEHAAQAERSRNWSNSAAEYRGLAYESAQYTAAQYATVGDGELDRLRATQADIDASEAQLSQSDRQRALQAEDRRYDARQEVLALETGSAPAPEEYVLAPEDIDVAPGIQEQSYDIPNGLVIERTVRVGNLVRRFRKVVTKTGVYYFEGEDSITEATWRRETTVILD